MKRLGVNIDHVATLRNARGEKHPDPISAALHVVKCGADSVTIHLREDRRHINDKDAKMICNLKNVLVNLEVSMNASIISNALRIKPNYICIVPENRKEITTEGGLNLKKNFNKLKKIIFKFKKAQIRTSLFINPSVNDVKLSRLLEVDCVEIHTGNLSNKVKADFFQEVQPKDETEFFLYGGAVGVANTLCQIFVDNKISLNYAKKTKKDYVNFFMKKELELYELVLLLKFTRVCHLLCQRKGTGSCWQ